MADNEKVRITVKKTTCSHYKPGDRIFLDGAFIATEKSGPVCMTAINAIYPFIYAARKGVTAEQMGFSELTFQCPDCEESAWFTIDHWE